MAYETLTTASPTSSTLNWRSGHGSLLVSNGNAGAGTFGGGTVKLQEKTADGANWQDVKNDSGAVSLIAPGRINFTISDAVIRVTIEGSVGAEVDIQVRKVKDYQDQHQEI